MKYANIIVDISLEKLDKTFQYLVPEELNETLRPGMQVVIPFGSRKITGYILELTDTPEFDPARMKPILSLSEKAVPIEAQLIELAVWMKETYGCTLNQALKTVLPSRRRVKSRASLIDAMRAQGKQTILLIPEISLTYQNLRRFYERFGNRVAVVNSRLSAGEKYDSYENARSGQIDIMIGPRSALFTPFTNLGMIIVDEEHESAYNSETSPRYRAVETAITRGRMAGAGVVLGSATPSLESYTKALSGEYALFRITSRARVGSVLPEVKICDLRKELREGNKTIFSRILAEAIKDRLEKREQVMLFLNRRGYAGFISCRSCGYVFRCPHCDVSLTSHRNGQLVCHYCGLSVPMPDRCPSCGSPYIAGFGLGTQKVETMVKKYFPSARTLRMDMDSTSRKDSHGKILSSFAKGEADILIGTQMIIKGHDFPRVTLVGILAADLSLYSDDFRAGERTFQLLTQAAGRAGRAGAEGLVVIQTYNPENYAIETASHQDYEVFYEKEMAYRRLLSYPPAGQMLSVLITDPKEETAVREAIRLADGVRAHWPESGIRMIGPSAAGISRIQDVYRQQLFIKHPSRKLLLQIRDFMELEKKTGLQIDLL